jgi:3-oxoacyl-[acyl-carrier-protein] synthase I
MSLRVVGVGARAALGLNALQVALAYRAQKFEPRSWPLKDERGRSVGACTVGGMGPDVQGLERWVRLSVPALREALSSAESAPIPMILAAPAAGRADDEDQAGRALLDGLALRSERPIDVARSELVRVGQAGGAVAFARAGEIVAAGAPRVLVGGVDSYLHPGVLRELDEQHRLHGLDVEDGFVPGEGAAFCLVEAAQPMLRANRGSAPARRDRARRAPTPDVTISGWAEGEESSVRTGEPNVARAMTKLVASLADGCDWVLSDVNGEAHRVREWGMVETRTLRGRSVVTMRPVDELGDVGAASGPLFVVLAATMLSLGCAPGRSALVALHSDGPARGVIRVEAPS